MHAVLANRETTTGEANGVLPAVVGTWPRRPACCLAWTIAWITQLGTASAPKAARPQAQP